MNNNHLYPRFSTSFICINLFLDFEIFLPCYKLDHFYLFNEGGGAKNKEGERERERTHPLAVFFLYTPFCAVPQTERLGQTIPFVNLQTV